MEILIYYVVPNVLLFGGIYLFSKIMEKSVWHFLEHREFYMGESNDR